MGFFFYKQTDLLEMCPPAEVPCFSCWDLTNFEIEQIVTDQVLDFILPFTSVSKW